MKRISVVSTPVLTWALGGLLCLFSLKADGADLAITPSSITNDFQGTIVLNITGLATGQTVAVEQYMDVNGNGVIDPGESLVRGFTVRDGHVRMIGGVRNSNVPGDEDGSTNGQIRVELPYPGGNSTLARIAGSYLFRIYDPLGGFTPVTNSFGIAQKVFPQGVTGQATAAGSPLAYAVMVMVVPDGDGSGVVADGGGNFTLYNVPGDYFLIVAQAGVVADQNSGGVTISANSMLTNNMACLVATQTISGKISDSVSGTGLPGIFMGAEASDGLFSLAFSDASGNFVLPTAADPWKLKVDSDSGVVQLGYLTDGNKITADTSSGSVSNLNFQCVKATALIYGSVRDSQSNAIAGLTINGNDSNYNYDPRGQTDANGNYSLAVFAEEWYMGPDNQALAAAGLIGQGANVTVADGQAIRQDFTVQHAGTHLRGRVVDTTGAPLGNMRLNVQIFSSQGPSSTSVYPQTQSDGSFDAGVSAGHWNVSLECSGATSQGVIGPNLDFDVVDGVDQSNIVLIAQPANAFLSGVVHDRNGAPISAQVYAFTTVNGTNYNVCGGDTDASGNYQMAVFNGQWQVGISGDLSSRGYDNPPNQDANVSAGSGTANIVIYPFGQTPPSLGQAGYFNGHFQFRLMGGQNQTYRIEACTNLNDPAGWTAIGTNTAFGGTFNFTDPNSSTGTPKFYRAVLVP